MRKVHACWWTMVLLLGVAALVLNTRVVEPARDRARVAIRGGRTIEQVLGELQPQLHGRVEEMFAEAGVRFPPERLALLGIKDQQRLEVWAGRAGRWRHVVDYPFTAFSGTLGPKLREGDGQIPEGIYRIDVLNPSMESACMNCGHCMAACPHGAFSLTAMPRETCERIAAPRPVPADQAIHLLKTRRSIRRYKPAPVPRPVLAEVMDVARWAPTAKNTQPVQYLVIESPKEVRRLAGLTVDWLREANLFPALLAAWDKGIDAVLRDAPHLVVAHAPTGGYKPTVDCTISLVYVDLAANAHGLGCCWAGIFMAAIDACKLVEDALQLPAGHKACGALMLGYPRLG